MKQSRRAFVNRFATLFGAASFAGLSATPAQACLYGTWVVRCPVDGTDDIVREGTCQHKCERGGGHQVFQEGVVTVVCPNGHGNRVDTAKYGRAMTSYRCTTPGCTLECRRN